MTIGKDLNNQEFLQNLEALANMGWELFPVHGITNGKCDCGDAHLNDNNAGKHPITKNGFKAATTDLDQISAWISAFPNCNFGVYLKGSGLVVIDVDPRNGGEEAFEEFSRHLESAVPPTVIAITGEQVHNARRTRGTHVYFRVDPDIALESTLGKHVPGVDVKHNGYVLIPGSKHFSGTNYEWAPGLSPWELEIAPLPEQIKTYLTKNGSVASTEGLPLDDLELFEGETTSYGAAALDQETEAVSKAREGNRNTQLWKSGLRIGSLISGGHISYLDGLTGLCQAGLMAGLDEQEVTNTLIRRNNGGALQLGATNPRGPELPTEQMYEWARSLSKSGDQVTMNPEDEANAEYEAFLNVLDWEHVFSDTAEERWFIPGILCEGRSHVVYADAGLGKSLLVLDACAALASGRSAFGFPPQAPLKVLYFDHENTVKGDVVPRLRAMGYGASDLDNLVYSSFPDMDTLDSVTGGAQMAQALDQVNPDLVIIDTLSRTVSGEENSNSTWLEFYRHTGKELKRRQIASIRIDHIGKKSEAGMRGGSAKKGDVDIVWNFTPRSTENRFKLTCEKSRVALPSKSLDVDRLIEPVLHHTVKTGDASIDWPSILAMQELFQEAIQIIEIDIQSAGSLQGQKAVWERVKSKASSLGINHQIFTEAHRAVKVRIQNPPEDQAD
jgi:hypothetical protein